MYDFRVVVEISTSNPFSRDSRSSHPKRLSSTGALRAAAAVAVILQFTTGGIATAITKSTAASTSTARPDLDDLRTPLSFEIG